MARRSPLAEAIRSKPGELVGSLSFPDLPSSTVAHGLARLAQNGELTRVRRGLYHVPTTSRFGPVPPDPIQVALGTIGEVRLATGGTSASSSVGFTTQLPMGRTDVISTSGRRIRRTSMDGVRILNRSPVRRSLTTDESAFLEVLRDPVHLIELPPDEACSRALTLISTGQLRVSQLIVALCDEPPRVRAMIGALAEAAGLPEKDLRAIRSMVNPRSRFKFGPFASLPTAGKWGSYS